MLTNTATNREDLRRDFEAGVSIKVLEKRFHTHHKTIHGWAKREGWDGSKRARPCNKIDGFVTANGKVPLGVLAECVREVAEGLEDPQGAAFVRSATAYVALLGGEHRIDDIAALLGISPSECIAAFTQFRHAEDLALSQLMVRESWKLARQRAGVKS